MMALIWLGFVIAALLLEALTMRVIAVWFAGGALAACVTALAGGSVGLQAGICFGITILLLIFTRPAVRKFMGK